MKIVIDIPKEVYESAKNGTLNEVQSMYICGSVAEGTPLPKGHGDLIDRNVVYAEFDKEKLSKKEMIGKLIVFGAPAVIPADK